MLHFLFITLQTMEALVQRAKNPREDVFHHGLIKSLVDHVFQKEGRTWNNIVKPPILLNKNEVASPQAVEQEMPTLLDP
jgi:hypothetical protein